MPALSRGISPVITSTILIGAIIVVGLSFMAYSISLANIQRYEVSLRNILAEEASKVVLFTERDRRAVTDLTIYVGIAKVINETTTYYLAVFTASQYELAARVYNPVTPRSVRIFNGSTFQTVSGYVTAMPGTIYIVGSSGDYVPLVLDGLVLYEIPYRQVNLVEVICGRAVLKEYLVVTLFMNVGSEYYELLRLVHRV